MSREQQANHKEIFSTDDLVDYFESGRTPEIERGVGTEHEKFGLLVPSNRPIKYEGSRGLEKVFSLFESRFGWSPERDEGKVLSLVKEGAAITLEPGGQLELSGRVFHSIHGTAGELETNLQQLNQISQELGLSWLGAGCHPLYAPEEIEQVPKSRYRLMAPYLESRGDLAHWMMKGTCTVQANLDYMSETDCREMVYISAWLSPVVAALFANSSVVSGRPSQYVSFRNHIWTRTANERCGTPTFMLDGSLTFQRYVDYLLDIPLMFLFREGRYHEAGGLTFRDYFEQGHLGYRATVGDWEVHLSTVFPEVRVKRFVEFRSADCGSKEAILALPALWKGLLYDRTARDEILNLLGQPDSKGHAVWYQQVAESGFQSQFQGRDLLEWADSVVKIAVAGLSRMTAKGTESEEKYLAFLEQVVVSGETNGESIARKWLSSDRDEEHLIALLRL